MKISPGTKNIFRRSGFAAILLSVFLAGCNDVVPPPNIVVEATGVRTPVPLGKARAFDENGNPVTTIVPTQTGPFPLGSSFVWWVTFDQNNEINGGKIQTVTVQDTIAPVISIPGDLVINSSNRDPVTPDIGSATATDIFPVTIVSNKPSAFYPGVTEVTWQATDTSGNKSQAVQRVTVNAPPPAALAPDMYEVYRVQVSRVSGTQNYLVSGVAGAVGAGVDVSVTNDRTQVQATTVSSPADGSFSVQIPALSGDKLVLVATVSGGTPGPQSIVYVDSLAIKNTYSGGSGNWFIGQLHAHSNNSDGRDPPWDVKRAYYDAGYDFVVSTDHRGTSPYYLAADDGMTPNPKLSGPADSLHWISGTELGYGLVHMNAWGHNERISVAGGAHTSFEDLQAQIDEVRAKGGIAVANHPGNVQPPYAWSWFHELSRVQRISMAEMINQRNSANLNLPVVVDLADAFRQVWWIGTDDCHDVTEPIGFNQTATVIQSDNPLIDTQSLIAAADSGNMYVRETATGPEISSVVVEGNKITVSMADIASNYNVTWYRRGNEVIRTDAGVDVEASYVAVGDEGYVRAVVEQADNQKRSYSQPLFIANSLDKSVAAVGSVGTSASNLVDNRSDTFWEAEAISDSFVIDTGKLQSLNAVRIHWDKTTPYRFNYRVEVSDTGAFSGEEREVVREPYRNRSASTIDFFDEFTRYLRIVVTGESEGYGVRARVSEVEVLRSSPAPTRYYVDNIVGDDANTGLIGSPKRTFDGIKSVLRPRDVLRLENTGSPFGGNLELGIEQSGKNPSARVVIEGEPGLLTEVDATGYDAGVKIGNASHVDVRYLDVHSALSGNLFVLGDASDIDISYCSIHDSAGHGILAYNQIRVAQSLVYGNQGHGVKVQGETGRLEAINNTVFGNGGRGIFLSDVESVDGDIFNNIIAQNVNGAIARGPLGTVSDGYNCIDGDVIGIWSMTGALLGDPLMADPANGLFDLATGSPCIDAGIDLDQGPDFSGFGPVDLPGVTNTGSAGSYSVDYRDIGALEAQP